LSIVGTHASKDQPTGIYSTATDDNFLHLIDFGQKQIYDLQTSKRIMFIRRSVTVAVFLLFVVDAVDDNMEKLAERAHLTVDELQQLMIGFKRRFTDDAMYIYFVQIVFSEKVANRNGIDFDTTKLIILFLFCVVCRIAQVCTKIL
jgi:hypothetical protein